MNKVIQMGGAISKNMELVLPKLLLSKQFNQAEWDLMKNPKNYGSERNPESR